MPRKSGSGLVSVVIPCYNQGRYLPEALQSLFSQTYPHLEIIVVDDGSKDATAGIARGLGDRIRFAQQEHRGASGARNLGLSISSGEYVQFLDADDKLEPDKILKQVEFLSNHPETGIVYSDVRYFSDEHPEERTLGPYVLIEGRPWTPMLWEAPGTILEKLIDRNVLAVNSALVRRDALAAVGPWNEGLCALEDWEYWIRCANAGMEFAYREWPDTLSLVRLHAESRSTDPARAEMGAYQMRLNLSRVLDDPEIRAKNCGRAIEICEQLGSLDRSRRFSELARATRGLGNRVKVVLNWLFFPYWLDRRTRNLVQQAVLQPVKRMLARILGRMPPS